MSYNPKRVDQLDASAVSLKGTDLLLASINTGSGFVSRKITLDQIKNFCTRTVTVLTGDPVIYDPTDSNLFRGEVGGSSTGKPSSLTKTVTKNCVLFVDNTWGGSNSAWDTIKDTEDYPYWTRDIEVKIDGCRINWRSFANNAVRHKLFLKAGQTVTANPGPVQVNGSATITTVPIKCGGVFLDTDKMKLSGNLDSDGSYKYHVVELTPGTQKSFDFDAWINVETSISLNNTSSLSGNWTWCIRIDNVEIPFDYSQPSGGTVPYFLEAGHTIGYRGLGTVHVSAYPIIR